MSNPGIGWCVLKASWRAPRSGFQDTPSGRDIRPACLESVMTRRAPMTPTTRKSSLGVLNARRAMALSGHGPTRPEILIAMRVRARNRGARRDQDFGARSAKSRDSATLLRDFGIRVFRNSGILESPMSGAPGFWNAGVQEVCGSGILRLRTSGIPELRKQYGPAHVGRPLDFHSPSGQFVRY